MKTVLHIYQPHNIRAVGGLDLAVNLGVALDERLRPLRIDHEIELTIRPPDGLEPMWDGRLSPRFYFAATRSIDSRTIDGLFYLDDDDDVIGHVKNQPGIIAEGPPDRVIDIVCERLVQNLVYPHGLPVTARTALGLDEIARRML
jgi:hypothetical protein